MGSKISLATAFLVALWLTGCSQSAAVHTWSVTPPASSTGRTALTAWTNIHETFDWQANLLVNSAETLNDAGGNVSLTLTGEAIEGGVYHDRVESAAERGEAPDIAYIDNTSRMMSWADAGYLWPLDDCRLAQPALADIRDAAWSMMTYREESWVMPVGLNARILFYNKGLLSRLGWSAERIAALPDEIRDGRFTQEDLTATAAEAIEAGVVAPGYGYWHYLGSRGTDYYRAAGGEIYDPEREVFILDQVILANAYNFVKQLNDDKITRSFVLDSTNNTWTGRLAWHDAVLENRVLFWNARSADWQRWTMATDDPATLLERFGFALLPSALPGEPGLASNNWSGFAVMSPQATGRGNQAAACSLLAAMTDADIALYAMTSSRLPVIETEIDNDPHLSETFTVFAQYMIDYALKGSGPNDPLYDAYTAALAGSSDRVVSGELSVEEGVALAVDEVRAALGSGVIIK